MEENEPVVADYDGACVSNLVPAMLEWETLPPWLPDEVRVADQIVLLVLDGLGWEQLQTRTQHAPNLAGMSGGPITTVIPSTTATAMTSIATGTAPATHGVIGYRVSVDSEVLNILRWSTPSGDARRRIVPRDFQPIEAFCGQRPPAVTKAEFERSGFSGAHLVGARFHGYRLMSSIPVEVGELLRGGEAFVYAYYDGIDKIAHERGLGTYYEAELRQVDTMVGQLIEALPPRAALVITADHGQVDTGDNLIEPPAKVLELVSYQSGEARFRWLHARSGRERELETMAHEVFDEHAWVRTREEILDAGWFGPNPAPDVVDRMGDVALVAKGTVGFVDPADSGPHELVGRHGSLTSAEMLVPLIATMK